MIALDTNVLLRALVDDPSAPRQCAAARELIGNCGRARVSAIVFVETLSVLDRTYRAPRGEVAAIAQRLLNHPSYRIEDSERLRTALDVFSGDRVDFADAVALTDARSAECTLHTFDRKLAKLEGTELVAPT